MSSKLAGNTWDSAKFLGFRRDNDDTERRSYTGRIAEPGDRSAGTLLETSYSGAACVVEPGFWAESVVHYNFSGRLRKFHAKAHTIMCAVADPTEPCDASSTGGNGSMPLAHKAGDEARAVFAKLRAHVYAEGHDPVGIGNGTRVFGRHRRRGENGAWPRSSKSGIWSRH
jgi:hypothetical protein